MRTAWTTVPAIAWAGAPGAGAARKVPPGDTRTVQQLLAAAGANVLGVRAERGNRGETFDIHSEGLPGRPRTH
jgi:hypothetical protein